MTKNKPEKPFVFMIAVITADGFIAKNSKHTPVGWTSKEDKEFFKRKTKEAGVVVMGSNTYEVMSRPLEDRLNIVYSRDKQYDGAETTRAEPKDLIEDLTKRGYKKIAICGGSTIYTMFMESGMVDKLYLTIEPIVFGAGLSLFNKEFDVKLELLSNKQIGENTILLEYNVIK